VRLRVSVKYSAKVPTGEAGVGDKGISVLIVEDEASIRRGLSDVLRYRGCQVGVAADGAQGLALALEHPWDLIVLDIMLPEVDGFTVCERVRAAGREMPVLMLTAKGDEDDIVRGFEAGANDYVTKPFGVRELTARLDALLRRSARIARTKFQAGPIAVDSERLEAYVAGQTIELSAREVRILWVLGQDAGRIVSRRALLKDAWDMNNADQLETRTVDVHIAKLRKKLGAIGDTIATVRGQGYRLTP
jgi:DNA-binding response OmpR family regulator